MGLTPCSAFEIWNSCLVHWPMNMTFCTGGETFKDMYFRTAPCRTMFCIGFPLLLILCIVNSSRVSRGFSILEAKYSTLIFESLKIGIC